MTGFWIIAALLLAGALLAVLPPLLRARSGKAAIARDEVTVAVYHDQFAELQADRAEDTFNDVQYEQGRRELTRRLLADVPARGIGASAPIRRSWGAAAGIALTLPVSAVLLYLHLGNPQALLAQHPTNVRAEAPEATLAQVHEMVDSLVTRLKQSPEDAQGWLMLGRSYSALGRFADADLAYAKAVELAPRNASLYVEYAETLAVGNGRSLEGRATELIQTALTLDPANQRALALAGTAEFGRHHFVAAVKYWQLLLQQLSPDSEEARSVAGGIDEARRAAAAGGAAAQDGTFMKSEGKGAATLSGTVMLSPVLAGKTAPNDTLFIFARANGGPSMPLLVSRTTAKDLPKLFTLDDSMSMQATLKLTDFSEVTVAARISKSGNAIPQSGDLQGAITGVKVGAKDLRIVIDNVVP